MLPLTPESFLDLALLSAESPAAVARAADEDVRRLFDQCVTAQTDIAPDWIAACKKYFHTEAPLPRQLTARDGLDDDLPQRAAPMARLTGRLR